MVQVREAASAGVARRRVEKPRFEKGGKPRKIATPESLTAIFQTLDPAGEFGVNSGAARKTVHSLLSVDRRFVASVQAVGGRTQN
jgi:hypothetical protein